MSGTKMTDVGEYDMLKEVVDRFRDLAQRVGAPTVCPGIPNRFCGSLEELFESGNLVKPEDDSDSGGMFVRPHSGQILRNREGEVVFLYIADTSNVFRSEEERNRIHMYWCKTLYDAWQNHRDYRYYGETNVTDTGFFTLENNKVVKMYPCKHCYKYVSGDYGEWKEFKYKKFATENSLTALQTLRLPLQTGTDDYNSEEKEYYICSNCSYIATNQNEFGRYGLCKKCLENEKPFLALRGAANESDIDNWVREIGDINKTISISVRDEFNDIKTISEIADKNKEFSGVTPLMYLVRYNPRINLIEYLVNKYKVNINAKGGGDRNALMHLIEGNNTSQSVDKIMAVVEKMRNLGANIQDNHTEPMIGLVHISAFAGNNKELKKRLNKILGISGRRARPSGTSYIRDSSGFTFRNDEE